MQGELKENVIEWVTGSETVSVALTSKKHITKVRKLVEQGIGEIVVENSDGSIFARIPLDCVKIGKKRELSEEARNLLSERAKSVFGANSVGSNPRIEERNDECDEECESEINEEENPGESEQDE